MSHMRSFGVVFSMLIVLAFRSSAQAESIVKEKAEMVNSLQSALLILADCDHDYDGHRHKAVQAIHGAIRKLDPHKAVKGKEKKPDPNVPLESQADSDAKMNKALKILDDILSDMDTAKYKKTTADIKKAIAEIKTALALK